MRTGVGSAVVRGFAGLGDSFVFGLWGLFICLFSFCFNHLFIEG